MKSRNSQRSRNDSVDGWRNSETAVCSGELSCGHASTMDQPFRLDERIVNVRREGAPNCARGGRAPLLTNRSA
jgi:hypothetical protein